MAQEHDLGILGDARIERAVALEAEDVGAVVGLAPRHGLDAAVVAVAAPDDAGGRPVLPDAARHVLDDGPHLRAGRRLARAQDHHHRLAALDVVDTDGQEAALVVVAVPEAELLAAVDGIDRVVDIERDLAGRGRKRGAELVDQGRRHAHGLVAARHVLQPAHGRLRAQGVAALRATSSRAPAEASMLARRNLATSRCRPAKM
jgi:hypothetical protein